MTSSLNLVANSILRWTEIKTICRALCFLLILTTLPSLSPCNVLPNSRKNIMQFYTGFVLSRCAHIAFGWPHPTIRRLLNKLKPLRLQHLITGNARSSRSDWNNAIVVRRSKAARSVDIAIFGNVFPDYKIICRSFLFWPPWDKGNKAWNLTFTWRFFPSLRKWPNGKLNLATCSTYT